MKRLLKSWVFWVFAGPVVLLPFLLTYQEQETLLTCRCDSARRIVRTLVKWKSVELFRTSGANADELSDLWVDLLPDSHEHRWVVHDHLAFGADGRRHIRGHGRPGEFASLLRANGVFADWLRKRLASRELSKEAVEAELNRGIVYPPGQYPFGWTPP